MGRGARGTHLLQLSLEIRLRLPARVVRGGGGGGPLRRLELFGEGLERLERLELELHVALDHHLLEGEEVVDGEDLLEHLATAKLGRLGGLVHGAELGELLGGAAHIGEVQFEQRLDELAERFEDVHVRHLVLLLVVEHHAVVVDEVHHWHRPLGTLEELRHGVEEPQQRLIGHRIAAPGGWGELRLSL